MELENSRSEVRALRYVGEVVAGVDEDGKGVREHRLFEEIAENGRRLLIELMDANLGVEEGRAYVVELVDLAPGREGRRRD